MYIELRIIFFIVTCHIIVYVYVYAALSSRHLKTVNVFTFKNKYFK